jgi:NAD(P)-dependent dehydrogenase (short-subunit alcohol dehydrogenase family)
LLQPGGSIVLNASMVSTTGSPAFSVYSATKAAVRSFARTWSVDLKQRKIRVNAISPGIIPTPGYNTSLGMTQEQVDQFVESSIGNIPLGRPGTADEIAEGRLVLGLRRRQLRNRHRVIRRWRLGSDITGSMPGTENATQSADDLLRKNLEAFGERDAEKRRTAISMIWGT